MLTVLFNSILFLIIKGDCSSSISAGTITVNIEGSDEVLSLAQTGGAWGSVYPSGDSVTVDHGPRLFLAEGCPTAFASDIFRTIPLLGKTFGYTVDLSGAGCACNVALYLVYMPAYDSSDSATATGCGKNTQPCFFNSFQATTIVMRIVYFQQLILLKII